MGQYCTWVPKVKKREGTEVKEVTSKLFKELNNLTKNREATKQLWGLAQTSEFAEAFVDLEYDSNGEVTAESIIKALGLEKAVESNKTILDKSREYKFKDAIFSRELAVSKAEEFNSSEKDFIATVVKDTDGYKVEVLKRTISTREAAEKVSFVNAVNNELLDLLREIGFDVDMIDTNDFGGLFDPTNAKLVDGLIKIIKIARGEIGEEAFPEEMAHLLLEGLQNQPLVQRLMNTLSREAIQEILGDQYEEYSKKYNDNMDTLKKEAAGKLLGDYIKSKGTIKSTGVKTRKSLLQRIWGFIKNLLGKITGSRVDVALNNARSIVSEIYEGVADRSLIPLIDKDLILNSQTLYNLGNTFNDELANLSKRLGALQAKKLQIEKSKENKDATSISKIRTLASRLEAVEKAIDREQGYTAVLGFLRDAVAAAGEMYNEIEKIRTERGIDSLKNVTDIKDLAKVAAILRDVEDFIWGYYDEIKHMAEFGREDYHEKYGLDARQGAKISDFAKQVLDMLNSMEQDYKLIRFNVIYAFFKPIYGEERAKNLTMDVKQKKLSLQSILESAERDVSFVDSLFSSLGDADDPMLSILNTIVRDKKRERDDLTIKYFKQIALWDEQLRKAGYRTDFIYERDAKGKLTGRLISIYDFDSYNQDLRRVKEEARAKGLVGPRFREAVRRFKEGKVNGVPRRINIAPEGSMPEWVPNPELYSKNKERINRLAPAQREYYEKMIKLKREMMDCIPSRGQRLYNAIYVGKSTLESVTRAENPVETLKRNLKKQFLRREDDLDRGHLNDNIDSVMYDIINKFIAPAINKEDLINEFQEELEDILEKEDVVARIEDKIQEWLTAKGIAIQKVARITTDIGDYLRTYTDSAFYAHASYPGHIRHTLPIYYSRRFRNMDDCSLDFSSCMTSYVAMALNYKKMHEIEDLLELTRSFIKDRKIKEQEGGRALKETVRGVVRDYKRLLYKNPQNSRTLAMIDDYFESVVYEIRSKSSGRVTVAGNTIEINKVIDSIRNYTGILGLGLNGFCAISNVTVGKLLQFIEAAGGEFFGFKDMSKAVVQYNKLLMPYLGEFTSRNKKSRLGLLIEMFDPMEEYYNNLRNTNFYNNAVYRVLGDHELGFIGMNAGEHLLHCQTMLAILNHVKVKTSNDPKAKEISLYDALEIVDEGGIKSLKLKEGLYRETVVLDSNGKPKRDDKGKIITEIREFTNDDLLKIKKRIKKVNQLLNGAFNADDKGAIHRYALGRLVMQFRQWMPAHYYRRFARGHYDADLEQWVEGYYLTLGKFSKNLLQDIYRRKFSIANIRQLFKDLSPHELANIRKALTEIGIFAVLSVLAAAVGGASDKDRGWAEKMAIFVLLRVKLEVGASVPSPDFIDNVKSLMQSPVAATKFLNGLSKFLSFGNLFTTVDDGDYEGWNTWVADQVKALPYYGQVRKLILFDDNILRAFDK